MDRIDRHQDGQRPPLPLNACLGSHALYTKSGEAKSHENPTTDTPPSHGRSSGIGLAHTASRVKRLDLIGRDVEVERDCRCKRRTSGSVK